MAQWLSPVNDYLNAAKSGTDSGLALARILNDQQQAAAKLAQSQQAQDDQTGLGYATLDAKRQEAQDSAAEKLQLALAQQASLNDWRNSKLDQGQQGLDLKTSLADALNNYRTGKLDLGNRALDVKSDLGQQGLDLKATQIQNQAQSAAAKLAQNKLWFQGQYGSRLSPTDKMDYARAGAQQDAALKALMSGLVTGDAYKMATNTIAQSQATIDGIKAKAGGGSAAPAGTATIPTTSAADLLSSPSTQSINLGGGVSIGGPTTVTPGLPTVSAADALTSTATSPAPAATSTAPATPQTQEEFDALSSGDLYVNPSDGLTYRKK